jgi:hypothetical protein
MVLILYLSLMYKTMGGGTWTGVSTDDGKSAWMQEAEEASGATDSFAQATGIDDEAVEAVVGKFSLAWQSLKQVYIIIF